MSKPNQPSRPRRAALLLVRAGIAALVLALLAAVPGSARVRRARVAEPPGAGIASPPLPGASPSEGEGDGEGEGEGDGEGKAERRAERKAERNGERTGEREDEPRADREGGGEGETQALARVRGHRRHRRGPHRRRSCILSMQTASKRLASGESPAITGTLSCADGAAVAGQPVALYERPRAAGQRRARFVASASTRGDGSYRLAPGPLSADSFLYVRFHRLRSARVLVRVGEQVTLSGSAAGAHALDASRHSRAGAQTMTFGGIVSPASAGATVTLQSERAGHGGLWRRIGRTRVEQDGAYSITLAVKAAGETEIRAVVSDNRHHLRSMSAGVSYVISAPARPDRRRARR